MSRSARTSRIRAWNAGEQSAIATIQDEDAVERGGVAEYNYGIPDKVG